MFLPVFGLIVLNTCGKIEICTMCNYYYYNKKGPLQVLASRLRSIYYTIETAFCEHQALGTFFHCAAFKSLDHQGQI